MTNIDCLKHKTVSPSPSPFADFFLYGGPAAGYCWEIRRISWAWTLTDASPDQGPFWLNIGLMNEPASMIGPPNYTTDAMGHYDNFIESYVFDLGEFFCRDYNPTLRLEHRQTMFSMTYFSDYLPYFKSRIEYAEYPTTQDTKHTSERFDRLAKHAEKHHGATHLSTKKRKGLTPCPKTPFRTT